MSILNKAQIDELAKLSTMSERIVFVDTHMTHDKANAKSRYAQISEFLSQYCKRYVRYQWVYNVLKAKSEAAKYSS